MEETLVKEQKEGKGIFSCVSDVCFELNLTSIRYVEKMQKWVENLTYKDVFA